jgi:hypothetical protein
MALYARQLGLRQVPLAVSQRSRTDVREIGRLTRSEAQGGPPSAAARVPWERSQSALSIAILREDRRGPKRFELEIGIRDPIPVISGAVD